MAVREIGEDKAVERDEAFEIRIGGQPFPMRLDDLAPRPFDGRGGDRKRSHPVGFEPQGQGEVVRGQGLVEQGLVMDVVALSWPPTFWRADVLERPDVLGALEHQVLEERGQPLLAGLLPDGPGSEPTATVTRGRRRRRRG